jgi:hypothetical protein
LARAESGKKVDRNRPRRFTVGSLASCSLPKFCAIGRYKLIIFFPGGDAVLVWYRKKPSEKRGSVSPERLQAAITKAVKKADPKCAGFVGVIVQRETPKTQLDANWAIKGVRFGKADRDKCSQALATIVERMQREFSLAKRVVGSTEKPDELESDVLTLIEPYPWVRPDRER